MKEENLKALLYPASYPRRKTCLRIAQVFDELMVIVPTEKEVARFPDKYVNSPVAVTASAPAPLGDRLSWFESLVQNWESWGNQMGLGTSVQASALMDAVGSGAEDSVQSILRTLKGGEPADPLLDAQIFLELSRRLDERVDELDSDLAHLASREKGLRTMLQGDVDAGPTRRNGKGIISPGVAPLSKPGERLKAWARVWLQAERPVAHVPVGETMAVKDLLDTAYEVLESDSSPVELLQLPLPLDPEIRPGRDEMIRTSLTRLLGRIETASDLNDDPAGNDLKKMAARIQTGWQKSSKGGSEGATLFLTLYPGKSWEEVLFKAAGLDVPRGGVSGKKRFSFFLV